MSEALRQAGQEVILPEDIDEAWLAEFNAQYADKDYTATVTTEDWLTQPEGAIGSAYYDLDDAMGADGWWQTISGKVFKAAHTNVPHYQDTGFANVLALSEASILSPDGSARPLAEGRLVLVRLDRLRNNPTISPAE
jgi:hypothetical protein